jgi:acyl transferase domain-containing protein/acyl carrier protein
VGTASSLHDICYSASVRRTHHDHRLALVAHTHDELAGYLEAFLEDQARPGMSSGTRSLERQPKLAFVFSGQGPRWWPLDKELLDQEKAFREVLETCDEILKQYTTEWSLLDQLTAEEPRSRLSETDIAQPALFAVQAALLALWRSWGIEPDAVIGHSIGEVAAAFATGSLDLEDALWLSYHRGRLIKQVVGKGKMALVGLTLNQAQEALAGYKDHLSVAANNGPTSTVLSGDPIALEELLAALEQKKVFCKMLPAVDFAAHSPQMEPLKIELEQVLEGLKLRHSSIPIYSTVTGKTLEGVAFDAHYWAQNLRKPVLFSTALSQMLEDEYDIFLEIHPHTVLIQSMQEGFRHTSQEGIVLPSLKRGEKGQANLLGSLGALYVAGYPVDWSKLYPSGGRYIRMPSYPWKRERYWLDNPDQGTNGFQRRTTARNGRYPFLGRQFSSAVHAGTRFWELTLGIDLIPFLADHRVQGLIILPAAAYLEFVLAAAVETFGPGDHSLEKVSFNKALVLEEDGYREAQLVLSPEMPGKVSFQVFSSRAEAEELQESWTLHASGTIQIDHSVPMEATNGHTSLEVILSRCPELIPGADHYQTMAVQGLQYGPEFQGVEQIWRRDGEAIGRLNLSDTVSSELDSYQVHPALLDACFQVLEASVPRGAIENGAKGDTFLPVGLRSMTLYDRPDRGVWGYASLRLDDSNADVLEGDVLLLDESGQVLLEALGLRIQRLGLEIGQSLVEDPGDWLYEIQWQPKPMPHEPQAVEKLLPSSPGSWLIFADDSGYGRTLAARLNEHGQKCYLVTPGQGYRRTYRRANREHFKISPSEPEDMLKLLMSVFGPDQPALRGVIHLWSLTAANEEKPSNEILENAQTLGPISVLHLIQALSKENRIPSPRLWLVTRGSQAVGNDGKPIAVNQSPLWGLGRVISYEHPELNCKKIDLDPSGTLKEVGTLMQEMFFDDKEDQVALRGETRYVPRLARYSTVPIEENMIQVTGDHPYHLEVSPPGILDNLKLRATKRQEPGPGQVEIQVQAAGLNFLDVLSALGMRPDQTAGQIMLGMECSGRVTALGEGVESLQVEDEVIAIAPSSFSRYVITTAPFVLPKPANLSFEEAATIPVAFMTAHYALSYLARLERDERVLIHAAAGGVGLAAVRLAQRVGAEIFATAGSPEKQEFLRSLGIEHIMSSRSLDFAAEVLDHTGGEGVDVVLNSLAGEFIPKSLSVLRANGRFLEIGKRDIYQNNQLEMGYLRKNISFHAIDLVPMFIERVEFCAAMLQELVGFFEDGSLQTLPFKLFPISEAESAFRYMAQANHIGKIVFSMHEEIVSVAPSAEGSALFRPDSTYLITGGLGGLGLAIARWMVEKGARHLALMGRSSASATAQEALDQMEKDGAQVLVITGDVSQEEQVANALAEIRQSLPPLRGVCHAAGVLDDGILLHLDQARFKKVLAPKMNGAWHLHKLTLNDPLDHFILFSSVASVLGSPGQGNYVAANAFLDSLANYRNSLGLPALAINWGAWSEVGLAAREDRSRHVTQQGMVPFTPEQGIRLMERILQDNPVQVTGLAVDWTKLPSAFSLPLLSKLTEEVAQQTGTNKSKQGKVGQFREQLLAAAPEERQELVETFLKEQIARVLRSSPSNINLHQPLDSLGIDSLMGFELINRLEAELEVSIPIAILLKGPSPAELTRQLMDQLNIDTTQPMVTLPEEESDDQLQAKVEQLSDAEVDALLKEMLEEEEDITMISGDTNQ